MSVGRHLIGDVPDWMNEGLCAQVGVIPQPTRDDPDGEVFFPGRGGSAAAAKRLCNGHSRTFRQRGREPWVDVVEPCPVRDQCLAYALSMPERDDYGVWGGTSEKERRVMRRQLDPVCLDCDTPTERSEKSGQRVLCQDCRDRRRLEAQRRYDAKRRAA